MKLPLITAVTVGLVAITSLASADDKDAKPASKGTVNVPLIIIEGRAPKPNVTIDVNRQRMRLPLKDFSDPAVERILRDGMKDPF